MDCNPLFDLLLAPLMGQDARRADRSEECMTSPDFHYNKKTPSPLENSAEIPYIKIKD